MRRFGATRRFGLVRPLIAGTALAVLLLGAGRTGTAAADAPATTPATSSPAASPAQSPVSATPEPPNDSTTHIPAATPPVPAAPTTSRQAPSPSAPTSPAAAVVAAPVEAPLSVVLTTIHGGSGSIDPTPTLSVRADGRAVGITTDAHAAPHPAAGHVPTDVLTASYAEAKSLASADMGEPAEGSAGSTLLDFLGPTPDQDIHLVVYGPDTSRDLTREQQANRARFAYLCTKLTAAFVPDH
ncbi:hypothetical protein KO481_26745 [Nocardia sp. NEAU-G5]|uniref:Uncharacterized protein n=1 Tax=Nocardia albiluteola TaxID=2842303 RepID=A0ABS6B5R0_9NOCA|nr:hypothetical protein [Nocardia albiluteola]MBU3065115.1 hypothetical protein [Nocardia albiluteola]